MVGFIVHGFDRGDLWVGCGVDCEGAGCR
jgi:hypothetical protein